MVLYGISGALFAYCVSLAVASPLAAFAVVAGYQVIIFVVRDMNLSLALLYSLTCLVVLGCLPFGAHLRQIE